MIVLQVIGLILAVFSVIAMLYGLYIDETKPKKGEKFQLWSWNLAVLSVAAFFVSTLI